MAKNDYQLAKGIIDSLELNENTFVQPELLPRFRKYLREIVFKRELPYQFTTRLEDDGKIKVIRIR